MAEQGAVPPARLSQSRAWGGDGAPRGTMIPARSLADGRGEGLDEKRGPELKKIAVERRQAARPPITGVVAERRQSKERLPALRLPHMKEGGEDKEGLASLKSAGDQTRLP